MASKKQAEERFRIFHSKEPRELIEIDVDQPTRWGLSGRVIQVYYDSDKWEEDGHLVGYYHPHDSKAGVFCYEPMGAQKWLVEEAPPGRPNLSRGTVLGFCAGWDLEREGDGAEVQTEIEVGKCWLCCHPSGKKYLFVVRCSTGKIEAIFYGAELTVEDVGIVG